MVIPMPHIADIAEIIVEVIGSAIYSFFWPFQLWLLNLDLLLFKTYCLFSPLSEMVTANCQMVDGRIVNEDVGLVFAFAVTTIQLVLMIIYIVGAIVLFRDIVGGKFVPRKKDIRTVTTIYLTITFLFFVYRFVGEKHFFILGAILTIIVVPVLFFGAYKIIRYLLRRRKRIRNTTNV